MWLKSRDGEFFRVASIKEIRWQEDQGAYILLVGFGGVAGPTIHSFRTEAQAKAAARRLADLIANAPRKTFISLSEWAEDTAAEQV